jgi:O-antigen/teichoic acid export membrane protein
MHSSDVMMLGYFHDTESIASYQVILPLAHLNTIVLSSFGLLFTPLAARLFARSDYSAINNLYWRTAIWLGILSFPIFAITFTMAEPLTQLFYGSRYEDSWVYLQILSISYYFHAMLGFNGLTLKVLGKLRYIVTINILAAVINIMLNLLLIPSYGALGACVATGISLVIHNILKQAGLRLATGINVFETQYIPLYTIIVASAFGLFLIQIFTSNFFMLFLASAVASIFVLRMCQHNLKIEQTFPELLKIPLLRFILGTNAVVK